MKKQKRGRRRSSTTGRREPPALLPVDAINTASTPLQVSLLPSPPLPPSSPSVFASPLFTLHVNSGGPL
jgi:hypothetical protein